MGQPACLPYRVERIKDLDGPLKGGYVIKEASGIIVAALPGAEKGPLTRCEGTARLMAAGANHLPDIIRQVGKVVRVLEWLRTCPDTSEDSRRAAAELTLYLDLIDRAERETPLP